MEPWIHFDRRHVAGGATERLRQDASTWTEFQHMVVGTQFRQRDDFAHDIGVNQKILAEPFVWLFAVELSRYAGKRQIFQC